MSLESRWNRAAGALAHEASREIAWRESRRTSLASGIESSGRRRRDGRAEARPAPPAGAQARAMGGRERGAGVPGRIWEGHGIYIYTLCPERAHLQRLERQWRNRRSGTSRSSAAGPPACSRAFYAGMRGASARIIDALPALGGQLMALYPEKYIFDVAGFPKVLAKDLVRDMAAQGLQFGATTHLGEVVTGLRRVEDDGVGHFVLETSEGDYPSRTIVIAAGIGAFEARRLGIDGEERFEEKGLYFKVLDPRQFEGKRVLLVGGGDSAFDWAVNLQGVASSVMLIHRRDGFRAHQATINQVQELHQDGRCELRTFWEVKTLHGNGRVEAVTIRNSKTKEEETFDVDAVIPLLGFHSDLGAIKEWGLDTEKADIKVDQRDGDQRPRHLRRGRHHQLSRQAEADRHRRRGGLHRGEQRGALHQPQGEGEPGALLQPGDLRAEGGLRRQAGRGGSFPPFFLSAIFGLRKSRSSPAPGSSRSSSIPITPLFGKSIRRLDAEPPSRIAASSSIQGECPTIATMAVPGWSPTWSWRRIEVGILGQRLAGHRRLGHPGDLDQDLRRLRRPGPRAGEHERGCEIALAEEAADVGLYLAAFVGERAVAVVGPLRRVAVAGVGVAVQEEEHADFEVVERVESNEGK